MANSDKKQAALDAIQDILKARLASKAGHSSGNGGQSGSFDLDIDPELDMPQANMANGDDGENVDINDPDGVLDQMKRNKQNSSKQQSGGSSQKQTSGGTEGDTANDDYEDDDAAESDVADSHASDATATAKNNKPESKAQDKPAEHGDGNDNANAKSDEDGKPEQLKKSDEYVKDWNDAIDKFDNDETSDSELDKQLNDENNSKGTKDAVSAIKSSRQRKLEIDPSADEKLKMPKNSESKTFDDEDEEGESEDEQSARVNKIQQDFNDTTQVQKDLQDIETDIAIKKGDAMRAKSKELDRIARKGQLMDFKNFGVDLFKAINSQLKQSNTPEDSYSRINPTYAGSDLLMPGQAYNDKYEKPVINVYFDQSGSWGTADVQKGIDALSSIRRFETQHKIKINLFYFADHLHDNQRDALYEGSTHGFGEVVRHVRDSGANNVIILTDSDVEHQTNWQNVPNVRVKGCVWYLWRNGSKSDTAPRYLSGMRDTYQYNLQ